ncbi:DUF3307 domain-containing protein [Adhaeribacter terreus]|uniref:DUF3307 domain-containing protein n=1 Tax=Adhaeribacter terreus TaxID=529703 RepID=A0ABW0EEE2_9BACT
MSGFENTELLLLVKLVLAHCISDFALQPASWVVERSEKKYRSKYLYIHAIVTGLVVQTLTQSWYLTALIFITHLLIDLSKAYAKPTTSNFLIDQLLHLAIIGFAWLFFVDGRLNANILLNNYPVMVLLTGYFMVTYPFGILIKVCTQRWRKPTGLLNSEHNSNETITDAEWNDLQEAGRWIGMIERLLIVTFVLFDHYDAIGLLIAGKTIIRFKESDKKKSEYFLFGTLLSIALSIFVGLAIKMLVRL